MSKSNKKEEVASNYKTIHMKNLNIGIKQSSDNINGKNM
jgi:hypothetical protein